MSAIRVESLTSYFESPGRQAFGQGVNVTMPFDLLRIGQALKEARIEKGLSLDEVAEALFIRKSALEAIESAYWELLPHAVYVKGYVKLYASYLNMSEKMERDLQQGTGSAFSGHIDQEQNKAEQVKVRKRAVTSWFSKRLLIICSSVIALIVGLVLFPTPQKSLSLTKLQEVSIGYFDTEHSMTDVRKLLIPYTERPWLNPFASSGERRTMILDFPENNPVKTDNPPTEVLTNDEG